VNLAIWAAKRNVPIGWTNVTFATWRAERTFAIGWTNVTFAVK
jgi:uncharacterized protein YbdZ (MbtH family)